MALFPISRYADLVGDGSGETDAATLNGSVTPQILRVKPAAGKEIKITRMIPSLTDGPAGLNSGGYGSGAILTNGFEIMVKRFVGSPEEEILWDVTGGQTIKTNAGWKSFCFDENISSYGSGDSLVSWRYSFFLENEKGITISDANKEELQIIINDDLAARTITANVFRIGISEV